jgi:hypothetical protein
MGEMTRTMTEVGGTFSTTFGTYPGETWPPPVDPQDPVTFDVMVTIRARDAAGNTASATVAVTVHSVWECFI